MTRTPQEIIRAVIANLSMARDTAVRHARQAKEADAAECEAFRRGSADAYAQAIALIRTEAASLLGDKP